MNYECAPVLQVRFASMSYNLAKLQSIKTGIILQMAKSISEIDCFFQCDK